MDALYDFLPVPSANAEDTTPRLYPKIVSKGDHPCRDGRDRLFISYNNSG